MRRSSAASLLRRPEGQGAVTRQRVPPAAGRCREGAEPSLRKSPIFLKKGEGSGKGKNFFAHAKNVFSLSRTLTFFQKKGAFLRGGFRPLPAPSRGRNVGTGVSRRLFASLSTRLGRKSTRGRVTARCPSAFTEVTADKSGARRGVDNRVFLRQLLQADENFLQFLQPVDDGIEGDNLGVPPRPLALLMFREHCPERRMAVQQVFDSVAMMCCIVADTFPYDAFESGGAQME